MEDEQVVRGKITCTFGDITFSSKFDSGTVFLKDAALNISA